MISFETPEKNPIACGSLNHQWLIRAIDCASDCFPLYLYLLLKRSRKCGGLSKITVREYSTLASFSFPQSTLLCYIYFFKTAGATLRTKGYK